MMYPATDSEIAGNKTVCEIAGSIHADEQDESRPTRGDSHHSATVRVITKVLCPSA